MADEWTVQHNPAAQQFEVALGEERAVLNYHTEENTLVITHTGVPNAWRGRGIAAALTQSALDYARSKDLTVVPACSYAAAYMRRQPE